MFPNQNSNSNSSPMPDASRDSRGQEASGGAVAHARRKMLIVQRRGLHHQGLVPMNSEALAATVAAMPGVEVLKVHPSHKHARRMASHPGEATERYSVHVDAHQVEQLRQSAPPHLIIEEDHPLRYGDKHQHLAPELHTLSAYAASGQTPVPQRILLVLQGPDGRPVDNAQVILTGDSYPSHGLSDASGQVSLELLQTTPGPVRSLLIIPDKSYWNAYLEQLMLQADQPNVITLVPMTEPNPRVPPQVPLGWGQQLMGLDLVPATATGRGVKVAVVDSGIDSSHPLLRGVRVGQDFTSSNPEGWRQDQIGHGSHCAGVIGANPMGVQALQMRGFVPEAEIHGLKVLPGGQVSSLLEAIDYCINHDIDVVNMSLGSDQVSEAVNQKLEEAAQHGVACIVAAGNLGGAVQFPASSIWVLAVGALGLQGEFPPSAWEARQILPQAVSPEGLFAPKFSCFGPQVAVCGPGVGIISTVPGGFAPDSGTSMAAPHVAGLAALLLSDPTLAARLGPRGPGRVAALFHLLRLLSSPVLAHDPENRLGAGVPRLHNLARVLG